MGLLDWIILSTYFLVLILLSLFLSFRQKKGDDYFLGGKKIHWGLISMSLAANQVSAISLIGAPAFVAIKQGGGLKWLQYEFAVPLAMIAIMIILVPLYRKLSGVTIFEYLENRFGISVRLTLSIIFMISRGLATGVVLYASALVLAITLGISLLITTLLMGIIAILYTTIGGITADVFSDALQLVILFAGTIVMILVVYPMVGGFESAFTAVDEGRLTTIDFEHHGLGDGEDYSFWAMLIGGFFLYVSYYGCDQSQAQRLMSTKSARDSRKSLVLNGLIRFPIVLAYCGLGVLLGAYIVQNPEWVTANGIDKDNNYLVPVFIVQFLPPGIVGLVMAGIFAATMSSIDSNINSLSATSMNDFIKRFFPDFVSREKRFVLFSRLATVFWGFFCIASGYLISQSSRTVIELVNMIGSAFYGPILAVFISGALLKRVNTSGALFGLFSGLAVNILFAVFIPSVSWLWWNPIGFVVSISSALLASLLGKRLDAGQAKWQLKAILEETGDNTVLLKNRLVWILLAVSVSIIIITYILGVLK